MSTASGIVPAMSASVREQRRRLRQRKRAIRRRHRRGACPRVIRWALATAIALFIATVHWLTAAGISIGRWSTGEPRTTIEYLPYLLVIVLLIIRELDSIAFGGLRLEMRQTKAEVARLSGIMAQRQSQAQSIAFNDPEATVKATVAAMKELLPALLGGQVPGLAGVTPPGTAQDPEAELAAKTAAGEKADSVPIEEMRDTQPAANPVDASSGGNVAS